MKIVLAPDSYKGSLSSIRVSEVMADAVHSIDSNIETIVKPMADGGEGTLDALLKATAGKKISIDCKGPLGEESQSWYVELPDKTAVIETANIAGLQLLSEQNKNPDLTTTYGIGEAILDALDRGNHTIIVTLGGSATNDGGLGMLQALGMKAWSATGREVGIYGESLFSVNKIDIRSLDKRLENVNIKIASDVDNPLTGTNGASHVYGMQKGANGSRIIDYDQALEKYGPLVEKAFDKQVMNKKGAGAAGGLGFALLALGGELQSGADLVAETIGLREAIQDADFIFTGEGQSDRQTLYGKAPGHVAKIGKESNKPTILLSGSLDGDLSKLNELFVGCFSIVSGPKTLEECIDNVEDLLFETTRQVTNVLKGVAGS
ncbi:glycerate kinase [Sediminibacillus massiliensis]|uniref:glycerate kinase n=1 Tax=Sediminibacillus massiliensis TaxID=1926277 RepID=UPI0009885D0D|nr:glycerate kinase [Sediminibacillus massiliensis]